MIPPFDDHGYLPSGIHPATLAEIAVRFGRESEIRQAEVDSLTWLIDLARRAGVKRLVIDGSFTTDKLEPNDVDCVLLIEPGFPADTAAETEIEVGLPFLQIEMVNQEGFDYLVSGYFATDEYDVPKGMIEVML